MTKSDNNTPATLDLLAKCRIHGLHDGSMKEQLIAETFDALRSPLDIIAAQQTEIEWLRLRKPSFTTQQYENALDAIGFPSGYSTAYIDLMLRQLGILIIEEPDGE